MYLLVPGTSKRYLWQDDSTSTCRGQRYIYKERQEGRPRFDQYVSIRDISDTIATLHSMAKITNPLPSLACFWEALWSFPNQSIWKRCTERHWDFLCEKIYLYLFTQKNRSVFPRSAFISIFWCPWSFVQSIDTTHWWLNASSSLTSPPLSYLSWHSSLRLLWLDVYLYCS